MDFPVKAYAAITRIKRHIASQGLVLRKARAGSREAQSFGDYYVVDLNRNTVSETHVDVEQYGKELKIIKPCESIVW